LVVQPPAPASKSISDSRHQSTLRPLPAINSQLPWRLHPSVSPSAQPPTCVGCCSSGLPSGPTSNPSSALWPSSLPFNQPPTRAGCRIVQFCLRTQPPVFTGCRALQLSFRTDLRLAPNIESSSSAFQPTSDSSSDITSLTSPSNQLPTCAGALSSSSAFRPTSRLAPGVMSSGFPFESASNLRQLLDSPVLSAINLRLLSEFESSGGAVDQLPTCVGY